MRILHLSSERSWRGGEQQLAYLIEESDKKGVFSMVAVKKGSAFAHYCKEKSIPHIVLGYKNELDVLTAWRIKKACKTHKIDLLHAHSSHSHAMAVISSVFGNKTPVVLSRKVDFPIKNNWFSRWKFNHKSIAQIICVSDAIRKILAPDLKRTDHLSVAHDGIDLDRFQLKKGIQKLRKEYKIAQNRTIVANISAIAPHKHYYTFVDTAKKVLTKNTNFHFFIIGDGPLRNAIESYVSQNNLQENITFTGFRQDIPEIFPDIDVFLMTSETEGLGSTLLDAAANHIPIVSTNAGGIPEFIEHKKTGFLANVYDSDELAKWLIFTADNPDITQKTTTNAYIKLLNGFTKAHMAQKTLEIYAKIYR